MTKSEYIVKVANLTKTYRRGNIAITPLNNVSLTVRAGEFVSLMGPSGSGKTTLMNVIAGVDAATSGSVVVAGTNLQELSDAGLAAWRNRNVGYIFQLYNLLPVLTAYENVELPLLLLHLPARRRREMVQTVLDAVGLADRADHYPRQLSGGQEQRVAIARAIVADPKIIVADEPTGDLDSEAEDEVLKLLCRLRDEFGKTIIMVTHDPKAAAVAGRRMHLDKGVLTELPGEREAHATLRV